MNTNQNITFEFPQNMTKALNMIAKDFGMKLERNTHYETINIVLTWFEGKNKKRIDFTLLDNSISVDFIINIYSFLPRLLDWGHKNIPLFPSICKGDWINLGALGLDGDVSSYYEKIKSFVLLAREKSLS